MSTPRVKRSGRRSLALRALGHRAAEPGRLRTFGKLVERVWLVEERYGREAVCASPQPDPEHLSTLAACLLTPKRLAPA